MHSISDHIYMSIQYYPILKPLFHPRLKPRFHFSTPDKKLPWVKMYRTFCTDWNGSFQKERKQKATWTAATLGPLLRPSLRMLASLLLLTLPAGLNAFYLPGVAPRTYANGENIELKVSSTLFILCFLNFPSYNFQIILPQFCY